MTTLAAASRLAPPAWMQRSFAGLTGRGMALVGLLCVINGVRRTIGSLLGMWDPDTELIPFSEWLVHAAESTAHGLIVAVPVTLAVVATYNLAPRRAALRYPALALGLILSTMVGVAAMLHVEGSWDENVAYFHKIWFRYALMCAFFTVVFVYLRRADESAALARKAERDRARLTKRTLESRLKMLQAQIEPHFLFNTLATVRRLYQTEPATGDAMLDSLMRYLEVALPQMRAEASTLGREADLAASYLDIQRIRMGRRLACEIDIPPALRGAPLPPMMLLTLVENAIKHGLAPLPEGGTVRISAAAQGHELEVRVADTGQGFTQTSGGGTGLANIRARLAALYGAAGRLSLSLNAPRGVTATIALPLPGPPAGEDRPSTGQAR
jgi:signal transduction histidine kinase